MIINLHNDDGECFKWSLIAASKWVDIKFHPECVFNLREFENNYDWSGLKFPVSIKDIEMLEIKNGISVNLLRVEDRDIYICQKSNCRRNHEINLMLISEGDRWHYTAIKSLSRLLASKNFKHHGKQ